MPGSRVEQRELDEASFDPARRLAMLAPRLAFPKFGKMSLRVGSESQFEWSATDLCAVDGVWRPCRLGRPRAALSPALA
jgi:hypothetical protein